jgi:hypothetical protein
MRDNVGTGWDCQVHGLSKKNQGEFVKFWDVNFQHFLSIKIISLSTIHIAYR